MKKSGFALKLTASIILMAFGALIFIIAMTGGIDYYSYTTWDETYGGDAYTGIQNAMSETSSNVAMLGYEIEDIFIFFFSLMGITVIFLGLYVLGSAITDKALINVIPSNTAAPAVPAAPQPPVYQAPPMPAYQPPQAPVYQPPQAPVYQPPQAPAYQPPQPPVYQPPQAPAYQPPQAPAYQPPQAPAYQPPQAPAGRSTQSAEMAKYDNLLARGIITQEEYDAKKKQILGL